MRCRSRDSNDKFAEGHTQRSARTSAIIPSTQSYPTRPRNESLSSSTSIKSINAETILPPVRSSSRPDSPPSTGLPLEHRSASLQSLVLHLIPKEQHHEVNASTSLTSNTQHAREAASISGRISEPPSPTTPNRRLSANRNERVDMTALRSPDEQERNTSQMTPPSAVRRSSEEQVKRGSAPRPELGYHRRSSSDMLALMSQQRQKAGLGGHHRRSSSTEIQNKALPTRPTASEKQARLSASLAQIQQQEYKRVATLLTRNRPLPAAAFIKEDLKQCRSAGERAILYAKKINDIADAESGLVYWLARTRPTGERFLYLSRSYLVPPCS